MALTRAASSFLYRSESGGQSYEFTVGVDQQDLITVRNVKGPRGLIQDPYTTLPSAILDDIQTAIGQVRDTMAQTSAVNGTLTFAAETTKSVTFATAMNNTNYRVHMVPSVFVPVRITNKTTAGFTVEVGVTFTGTVGYDVFV